MENIFSLFDLLILIGIVQGIVLSTLLLTSKRNKKSNLFLALGLLSFCLLCTKPLLHTLHLWDTSFFRYFPNAVELVNPPLIFFYTIALIHPDFKFKSKHWLHFIPFFLAQSYAFIVYFVTQTTSDFQEKDIIANSFYFDEIKQYEEYLQFITFSLYLYYGFKELVAYKKWVVQNHSDNTFPSVNWLITILYLFAGVLGFKLINNILDLFFGLKEVTIIHWHFMMLVIAGLTYYLGLKGYLQPNFNFSRDETNLEEEPSADLPKAHSSEVIQKLEKAMNEDKLFLQPKLSLQELSQSVEVNQRDLSQLINQHFQLTFKEFINQYRVEEVKGKLNDTNYSHMSILGIALESGFNSEASFYRIFKKSTGVSPKEFSQQQKVV